MVILRLTQIKYPEAHRWPNTEIFEICARLQDDSPFVMLRPLRSHVMQSLPSACQERSRRQPLGCLRTTREPLVEGVPEENRKSPARTC